MEKTKLTDRASVEQILREMTVEEKARLVVGASPFYTEAFEDYGIPASMLLDGATGFSSFQSIWDAAFRRKAKEMEELGTPIDRESLSGLGGMGVSIMEYPDLLRSAMSEPLGCYPPGILLGSTWNPEVVEACGTVLAKELGSKGVDVILGPNVNIHRDPLGGRVFEGYSEDPYLVSQMAPGMVRGIQRTGLAANAKHYAANNQETGRMGVNEHISERALREIYLPGFKACVDAGCKTIMSAYNQVNGKPCAQNAWLLQTVLRDEWGFDGYVVSDWAAAYDQVEALNAGNDLIMPGPRGIQCILRAVESGRLPLEQLDRCAGNILRVLLTLPAMSGQRPSFHMQEAVEVTEAAAREGIVLLQNDGTLPLTRDVHVAFFGKRSKTFAGSGAGSAGVHTNTITNPVDSTAFLLGEDHVSFDHSTAMTNVWVVTVGANGQEGADRTSMDMDADDREALELALTEAEARNGRVILVLNTAGPVSLMDYKDRVNAILCAFYPGMQGGKVVADMLFGLVNPSGKLPLSYPKYYRDCPSYRNFPGEGNEVWYGEGIYVGYRYYDTKGIAPLYPFGFGLSYTSFALSDCSIPEQADLDCETISVTVTVSNTGSMDGSEVVQLYVHDVVSKLDKPYKELKGFQKVFLHAGESKQITLRLSKADLASFDPGCGEWVTEAGEYELLIGTSSGDIAFCRTVNVTCTDPSKGFGPHTTIGTIVADPRAVTLLNETLQLDLVATVGTAIVWAPNTTWSTVWRNYITPALQNNGWSAEKIENTAQQLQQQLAAL